ncbi:hypothetical protein D9M71_758950 [compost metagenome]
MVGTRKGVRPPGSEQPVEDAHVLEDLLAAGLDAFAARAMERLVLLLQQPEGHATPGQFDGQGQTSGTGATDHNIRGVTHRFLQVCVICTYLEGMLCLRKRECKIHIFRPS